MSFSAYLVGTYERRFNIISAFQIINPTTNKLNIVAAFFDDNGNYLCCVKKELGPNDVEEIGIPPEIKNSGVVKILSYHGEQVKLGIVGYQRHLYVELGPGGEKTFSEAGMASVPNEYAQPEFDYLRPLCPLP